MEIKPTALTTHILTTIINSKPEAYAMINGYNNIQGPICFYPFENGSILIYEVHHLPVSKENDSGIFAFHIHEGNTCLNDTNVPFEKTLGHFNSTHQMHPYHLGDLPPLFARKGTAWGSVYIDKFAPKDIIGRTIVIHANPDDFHTQPSGNSGTKIACGEIKEFY